MRKQPEEQRGLRVWPPTGQRWCWGHARTQHPLTLVASVTTHDREGERGQRGSKAKLTRERPKSQPWQCGDEGGNIRHAVRGQSRPDTLHG
jgi:hypothetical protein